MHDSLNPDRIVVGADDPQAAARVGELFSSTGAPLIVTDATTSETIKYASNAFLATKLSFVNALAGLCEEVGADARDVLLGLGYDKRIGFEFLRPGPGWGGSCLPKDTAGPAAHRRARPATTSRCCAGAIASNDEQLARVVAKVEAACGRLGRRGDASPCWGLTFKANTDDRRDSPSLQITRPPASSSGATVQAFDPTVDADGRRRPRTSRGLHLRADPYEAATGARALVVLTEWDEFRWLDFARVRSPSWPSPRSSTRATCSTRPPCGASASATRGSAAGEPGRRRRRRRVPRLAPVRPPHRPRRHRGLPRRPLAPARRRTSATCSAHERFSLVVTDVSEKCRARTTTARSTRCATSPRRPRRRPTWPGPLDTLAVGSEGTRRLLELARAHGARFLMASTSEIYGDPEVHPQVESLPGQRRPHRARAASTTRPSGSPRASPWPCTAPTASNVGIARIFNTYGPRLSPGDGRVVSNFIVQALRGEPLTVYGDGSQTRSLCFVDDEIAGPARPARLLARRARSTSATPTSAPCSDLAQLVLEVDGVVVGDRLRAAAHRRPDPALPRHHAGPARAGLGADDRPAGGH